MTALEAYKNVLRELDKFETPDFDPGDFTYWFNNSINKYVNENYMNGDVLQKDLDDIRVLLSEPQTNFTQDASNKSLFSLPEDYLHILDAEATGKALSNYRRWKKDDVKRFELRRERTNRKGVGIRNQYDAPSEDNAKYRIVENKMYVLLGDKFEPTALQCWYIKKPQAVVLGPLGSDYGDPAYNSVLQFPDYVCLEIIKVCKTDVLELFESSRLQSTVAMEQLQKK